MDENERKKYNAIASFIKGDKTIKEVENELGISERQFYRLKKKFKEEGENGFIHKNKGRISEKKIDRNIIKKLEDLYIADFFDYSIEAFYEEIKKDYKISYSIILKKFKEDDIISPYAHKGTVKLYKEKMENAIKNNTCEDETKLNLYEERKLQNEKAHIRRSSNLYAFGQEVQMDACFDNWFGDFSSALHLAVDKGTKKVLSGQFEYEEISEGYYIILFNMIINYGIPRKIKTDNRNSFSNNKNKVNTTQFGMICQDLNIILETTSIATAKPNVERENGTFKRRLKAELRHNNINNIDDANKYLNEIFIPKMNSMFSYRIDEKNSMMRKNDYSRDELSLIISERYKRLIDNSSAISFKGEYYVPAEPNSGEIVSFKMRTECLVLITYDQKLWCKIENNYYILVKLEKRDTTMNKENNSSKTHYTYLPPKEHPWRKNMMLKKQSNSNNSNKK